MSERGIMVGMAADAFSPNTQLTRAQYTAILCNLAPDKSNGLNYIAHLTDVPAGAWYAEVAEWGVTNGIIAEIDGRFEGDAVLSRELMASMTARYLSKYYSTALEYDYSSAGFADEGSIAQSYLMSVNLLANNGLLAGRDGNNFEPQGTLTRAEAAAMAVRLTNLAGESEPGDTDEPDAPAEEPEQPPVEEPSEPEQPPVEEPDEPEQPPQEEPGDESWSLDGAPDWFLIGQPDYFSNEEWQELISYWNGKERPSEYPARLPAGVHSEEQAWREMNYYQERLYDLMQRGKADEALAAGNISLTSEEETMIQSINQLRTENGQASLTVSPALCTAATIRAKEALTCEAHKRPDGSSFMTVLKDENVGLEFYKFDSNTNSIYLAEN